MSWDELEAPQSRRLWISGTLSSFSSVSEAIDAAIAGINKIEGRASPHDLPQEVTAAQERMHAAVARVHTALEKLARRVPRPVESGFDEVKLVASIEKWQRRYLDLEQKFQKTEKREEALRAANNEAALRVERALHEVEALLEQEEADDETH
jgi:hypothetical protein